MDYTESFNTTLVTVLYFAVAKDYKRCEGFNTTLVTVL